MPFNSKGLLNGVRPAQPGGAPFASPTIDACALDHKGKYPAPGAVLVPMPLALHHILPWLYLWNFWNKLMAAGWHDALRDWLAVLGFPKPTTADGFKQIGKGTFTDVQDWETKLCWAPYNLVRGPENRSDDPNRFNVSTTGAANYDKIVDFLGCKRGKEVDRVARQVSRGPLFVKCSSGVLTGTQDGLSKEIRSWKLDALEGIVEFDPTMWEIDGGSPAYVPGNANAVAIHPEWKFRTK